MYFVYLLKLEHAKKRFYFGSTPNLERRIKEHRDGKYLFTKNKRPIKLLYFEGYPNKQLALIREKNLKKSGSTYTGLLKRLGIK